MKKTMGALVLIALLGGSGWLAYWWFTHSSGPTTELVLYGNVDLRQIQLAFNNSERIAEVKVWEGDRVAIGQVLATLETSRLKPMVAEVEAQVEGQKQVLKRLLVGSRPEEIAQAEANVASAAASVASARENVAFAREKYERYRKLGSVPLKDQTTAQAVSKEDIDNASNALADAEGRLIVNQKLLVVNEKALDLAKIGPRQEDKDQAAAQLREKQAQLALLKQQLLDADLRAPCDAVVRTRLMEPGEMATPAKAVFSLAIIDKKWVRAYVSEPDLGKVKAGMQAKIAVDSFPNRLFDGQIGFISPVAEFTPKSVQTEELRTSLVFEVRVYATDPDGELSLGMPATVYVPLTVTNPTR